MSGLNLVKIANPLAVSILPKLMFPFTPDSLTTLWKESSIFPYSGSFEYPVMEVQSIVLYGVDWANNELLLNLSPRLVVLLYNPTILPLTGVMLCPIVLDTTYPLLSLSNVKCPFKNGVSSCGLLNEKSNSVGLYGPFTTDPTTPLHLRA